MVNIWARCLVLATMGLSSLYINGQVNKNVSMIDLLKISEEKTEELLKILIEQSLKISIDMKWMTSQNRVLEVKCKDKQVIVNLAEEITGYGGGTNMEYLIGAIIMNTVFENTGAETVTILVNGQADKFPEGSDYSYCTRADYEAYYQLDEDN